MRVFRGDPTFQSANQTLMTDHSTEDATDESRWYALFTTPRHEQAVARHLDRRRIESFVPTWETQRLWKNRQKKTLILPLFPCYLFVRIDRHERGAVLDVPGAVRLVGNHSGPIAVPSDEVDFLRSDFCHKRLEPYHDLAIGHKVRIKFGPMQGVEGVLIRKNDNLRFVLRLQLIGQNASLQISANDLEAVSA